MATDFYFYNLGTMCLIICFGGWSSSLFLQSSLRLTLQVNGNFHKQVFSILGHVLNLWSQW